MDCVVNTRGSWHTDRVVPHTSDEFIQLLVRPPCLTQKRLHCLCILLQRGSIRPSDGLKVRVGMPRSNGYVNQSRNDGCKLGGGSPGEPTRDGLRNLADAVGC